MNPAHPDPHTTIHPTAHAHHVHEAPPLHDAPDEWHDHSHDERPQHAHGEVQNSNLVLSVGVALAAIIAFSSLAVYGFYVHYNTQRADDRELTTDGAPALITRHDKSLELGLVDHGGPFEMNTEQEGVKKTVTFAPIETAIDQVARRYTSGQPASPPAPSSTPPPAAKPK